MRYSHQKVIFRDISPEDVGVVTELGIAFDKNNALTLKKLFRNVD